MNFVFKFNNLFIILLLISSRNLSIIVIYKISLIRNNFKLLRNFLTLHYTCLTTRNEIPRKCTWHIVIILLLQLLLIKLEEIVKILWWLYLYLIKLISLLRRFCLYIFAWRLTLCKFQVWRIPRTITSAWNIFIRWLLKNIRLIRLFLNNSKRFLTTWSSLLGWLRLSKFWTRYETLLFRFNHFDRWFLNYNYILLWFHRQRFSFFFRLILRWLWKIKIKFVFFLLLQLRHRWLRHHSFNRTLIVTCFLYWLSQLGLWLMNFFSWGRLLLFFEFR